MQQPLISIVMPCYNAASTIGEAMESVRQQSYSNWELIVVDDNSDDRTPEVIKEHTHKDKRIRFFQLEMNSGGPAMPRNKGLDHSRGEIICFLDADDIWYPEKLEIQVSHMINKRVLFSYSAYDIRQKESKTLKQYTPESQTDYQALLRKNTIGCLTVAIHKSLVKKNRFKDIGHEDHEFWLRIAKSQNIQAHCCSEKPLAEYRQMNASRSSNKLKMALAQWHIFYRELELGLSKAIVCYLIFLFNYIWKYRE